MDVSGNVFMAGYSIGSSGNYEYATIKYSGPPFGFTTTSGSLGFVNKQFQFALTGPAGSNVVISASTNLQTWVPVITNTLTGGALNYTDAVTTNFIKRYYRANLK